MYAIRGELIGDEEQLIIYLMESAMNISRLPMNREGAWKLALKYNNEQSVLNHYLESEAVMRALARKLGQDEEYWGMLGLLHDLDWQQTKKTPELHCTRTPEMLREAGFDEYFVQTVLSHGYGTECGGPDMLAKQRSTQIQHALAAAETVTGLVHTAALMREDRIATLELRSVMKKFKDKSFAAKVNREVIRECEQLGITLDEFLELAIVAIRGIAGEVGLV